LEKRESGDFSGERVGEGQEGKSRSGGVGKSGGGRGVFEGGDLFWLKKRWGGRTKGNIQNWLKNMRGT